MVRNVAIKLRTQKIIRLYRGVSISNNHVWRVKIVSSGFQLYSIIFILASNCRNGYHYILWIYGESRSWNRESKRNYKAWKLLMPSKFKRLRGIFWSHPHWKSLYIYGGTTRLIVLIKWKVSQKVRLIVSIFLRRLVIFSSPLFHVHWKNTSTRDSRETFTFHVHFDHFERDKF